MFLFQQQMVMAMNGKTLNTIIVMFAIGFAIGKANSRSINSIKDLNKSGPTNSQYLNRLTEFFDDDLDEAKKEYFEYIDMGFNPSDAFDITKAKARL